MLRVVDRHLIGGQLEEAHCAKDLLTLAPLPWCRLISVSTSIRAEPGLCWRGLRNVYTPS